MIADPFKHRRKQLSEFGPQHPFCDQVHDEKYRGPGESFPEAMNRIASAMSDDEAHYRTFRDIIRNMRFMPAGRVQAAVGSSRSITPYNCYVSGTIADSFREGHGSIMGRASEACETLRLGGGIGYDFSGLRPRGAKVRRTGSNSTGPVSFMGIYDAICNCVASAGHRRGAQMGVLRIDHPDIEEFIHAKQNSDRLTGFNLSVAVTNEFMLALQNDRPFELRFDGQVEREVNPKALWEMLMRSTWDWGEPGVLFIDHINEMNNLYYCEKIAATNPCGEQPLPPYGACLLGSFNLVKYLQRGTQGQFLGFDWHAFAADIPPVVRAMDNVVDRATYPLFEQEQEAKSKRRMGLGVTALANAGEALGHPYGSPGFLHFEAQVLRTLRDESYDASAELAREKGSFKLYDSELYQASAFFATLHQDVQEKIRKYGIRNSHLTSIAPCGTISMAADNVSSGIEPVFAHEARRMVHMPEGQVEVTLQDYGLAQLDVRGKSAAEVTVDEHLAVLTTAAKLVDSAVSKTLNVPHTMPWEDFKSIYVRAWEQGAKGCTTFTSGGKREGMMTAVDETAAACTIDENGIRSCE